MLDHGLLVLGAGQQRFHARIAGSRPSSTEQSHVQAEGERMTRLVRIVGELRQLETRDQQKVVLLAAPPRLPLDRREVVRVELSLQSCLYP
jgi:hypothetical protein